MPDMNTPELVRIPLSKKKLWLLLLASVVFVGLSVWYVIAPPDVRFLFLRDPLLIRLVGVAGLLLFGGVGVFIAWKLGDAGSGLELMADGFTDNSSGVSAGFVRWADVTAIDEVNVFGQQFLLIAVRNPEAYINRHSGLKRRGMAMNHNRYGTPISLSANTLQISFAELRSVLMHRFLGYQASSLGQQSARPE